MSYENYDFTGLKVTDKKAGVSRENTAYTYIFFKNVMDGKDRNVSFELPKVKSRAGTIEKVPYGCIIAKDKKGYTDHSIKLYFDDSAENLKAIQTVRNSYEAAAKQISIIKKEIKFSDFDYELNKKKEYPSFKCPLFYPTDEDGNPDFSKSPSLFCKLNNFEPTEDKSGFHSKFVGINGDEIPWEVLNQVEIEHIPIISWRRNYWDNKKQMTMQWALSSSVVTSIVEKAPYVPQEKLLKEYKANDEAQRIFMEQMAKINDLKLKALQGSQFSPNSSSANNTSQPLRNTSNRGNDNPTTMSSFLSNNNEETVQSSSAKIKSLPFKYNLNDSD